MGPGRALLRRNATALIGNGRTPRRGTDASRMPSPIAWYFSARQRAAPCSGNIGDASPTLSRYSQITGLSNNASPSSVTSAGTLDSGLIATNSGRDALASVVTNSICLSISRVIAQARTFRT